MNTNIKNILKEKIIRINLAKKEIYTYLKKSIKQNNNIENKLKIYVNHNISKNTNKNNIMSRKHKICIITGKRSAILKGFNFSRYVLKNLILENKFTNIKKKN